MEKILFRLLIQGEPIMDMKNINTFIYTAELGSFTKAAELLGYSVYGLISDPAVGGGAWHRPF